MADILSKLLRVAACLCILLCLLVLTSSCHFSGFSAAPSEGAPLTTPDPTFEPTPTPLPTPIPTPIPTPAPYASGFDLGGTHYPVDVAQLELRNITDGDLETFRLVSPYLEHLTDVDLGSEASSPVSWSVIRQLQEIAPHVSFHYSFSLYGVPLSLDSEVIDLRKIPVSDNGNSVMEALPCMKRCTTLDMDQSGVDDEHMVIIRDAFPQVEVIWRVWFSTMGYSARTNVKTILASLTGGGPYAGLTDETSCLPLTYCTKVINLDLGHNSNLRTLSFLRFMPDLEVFITYENYLRDVDDLAYCKKLRYLELFGSSMYNINSIAELYELTDLQLGGCYNLTDISPIIPADRVPKLERLWLTPGEIPREQIEEFQANHPSCIINDSDNGVGYYWRFIDPIHSGNSDDNRTPQYRAIVDTFHYGEPDLINYNFSKNDPYFTAEPGIPVSGDQILWFYGG